MLDGAVVDVAHGQMNEEQLSTVMERHGRRARSQILVCTTIIETGIDMPNVNTLIIEDADQHGSGPAASAARPRRAARTGARART